uniref:Uncharacterized protein n=1 Tax=Ananas comosus var. bracteatus TaxID=296719 RepID=A0A6V7Q0A5_ANACO|nr:unnamed protein product [Ananas comosus var. bracteatus]
MAEIVTGIANTDVAILYFLTHCDERLEDLDGWGGGGVVDNVPTYGSHPENRGLNLAQCLQSEDYWVALGFDFARKCTGTTLKLYRNKRLYWYNIGFAPVHRAVSANPSLGFARTEGCTGTLFRVPQHYKYHPCPLVFPELGNRGEEAPQLFTLYTALTGHSAPRGTGPSSERPVRESSPGGQKASSRSGTGLFLGDRSRLRDRSPRALFSGLSQFWPSLAGVAHGDRSPQPGTGCIKDPQQPPASGTGLSLPGTVPENNFSPVQVLHYMLLRTQLQCTFCVLDNFSFSEGYSLDN